MCKEHTCENVDVYDYKLVKLRLHRVNASGQQRLCFSSSLAADKELSVAHGACTQISVRIVEPQLDNQTYNRHIKFKKKNEEGKELRPANEYTEVILVDIPFSILSLSQVGSRRVAI